VNATKVDAGFDAGTSDNAVYSIAGQTDGQLLAGGSFYNLGGLSRPALARLQADGRADSAFNASAAAFVYSLVVQTDGRLLAGGSFTTLGGATRNYLGRLNPDGTLDSGFNPGADSWVYSLTLQENGQILVGGSFATLGGTARSRIGRLNPDGTLDASFNPGADNTVCTMVVQPDGKILVGGSFTTLGGQPRTNLARLYPDGTLDNSFNPVIASEEWPSQVSSLALQADGKILVGGTFSALGGQPRANLARLNADGTLDPDFKPQVEFDHLLFPPSVVSLVVQTDGKILMGGDFITVAGQPRKHLARLNANGTLDLTFNPVTGDDSLTELNAVMVQADGKILAGGSFKSLGGQPRTNLARLTTSQPATQSLSRTGSTLTWLRGASSPEVWRTTFDYSSNGIDWSSLGGGSRIAGGWQLDGLSLPSGGTVRARGFLAASYGNASSGFVETLLGAPVFTTQPLSQTFNAGSTASFNVAATGPEPLSFQWLKDGVPLNDAPGIAGAASPSLRLTNVLKAAEGSYRLVVMNPSGSVTSQVATLTVIDPVILSSPYGCYGEPGQSPTLSVMAGGTALSYQWWKDGTALLQGTSASLTLTNLQLGDAGNYCVMVSNQFGSLTSAVATVRVNLATLDKSFTPAALGSVSPVAMQADGKILVGGAFNSLAGQSRAYLGRLNPEGSLDTSFNPGANATLYSLAVQPDGKILAGGDFTSLAGYSRVGLGRLNPNGTLDTGFSPTILAPPPGYTRTVRVQVILLQPDGKLLIGGRSSLNGGTATGFVYRLNTNGTTDTTFVTTGDANGPVASLALQPDGKILVGGLFTYLRSQPRNRLGRLNADGTIDKDFNPNADNSVFALALQADGKILVGGSFATLASQPRTNLARLNPDGTLDSNFALAVTGGSFPTVYSVVVQVDGNILLSGFFTTVAGQARAHLARINSSGGVDPGFNPGPNSFVYGLALQADGNLLAVGDFTVLGGQPRTRIGR
ncbi:MAG TPA: immunoglobulin domain-containing protein, partial [Candidatus Sulfotelmatobacter sp.]|nr:immunoglobulin domain-containing protein [Candidatus Sulfotelmatobacter sp.]